jgi:phosphoribosylglycinamide formyltransferase-1
MRERLISEAIKPVVATCDTARMAVGEPGLPEEFVWRGQTVKIVAVLSTWRETGKCRHGSPERYVRKHWFEVDTASFGPMKIYFDRQPRGSRKSGRWWLFSISGSQEVQQDDAQGGMV